MLILSEQSMKALSASAENAYFGRMVAWIRAYIPHTVIGMDADTVAARVRSAMGAGQALGLEDEELSMAIAIALLHGEAILNEPRFQDAVRGTSIRRREMLEHWYQMAPRLTAAQGAQ